MFTRFLASLLVVSTSSSSSQYFLPAKRAKMLLGQSGIYKKQLKFSKISELFCYVQFLELFASHSKISDREFAQKILQQECVEKMSGCEREEYIESSSVLVGQRYEISSRYFEFYYKYCAKKCTPGSNLLNRF